jgi:hypothetical protein
MPEISKALGATQVIVFCAVGVAVLIAFFTNLGALMFMNVDTTPGGNCTTATPADTSIARYSEHEIFIGRYNTYTLFTLIVTADFGIVLFMAAYAYARQATKQNFTKNLFLTITMFCFLVAVGSRIWLVVEVETASAKKAGQECVANWDANLRSMLTSCIFSAISFGLAIFLAFMLRAAADDDTTSEPKEA